MSFVLHPQLEADTIHVCDLRLCRVLLMNNQLFPWLILVPMRNDLREIFDCSADDYPVLTEEIRLVSQTAAIHTKADKMNVATLGNMVPQLHIHIIARYTHDKAWPQPVWNIKEKQPYAPDTLEKEVKRWQKWLQET